MCSDLIAFTFQHIPFINIQCAHGTAFFIMYVTYFCVLCGTCENSLMHGSTNFQSPPTFAEIHCSCYKVQHKQEVWFLLYKLGQIVT